MPYADMVASDSYTTKVAGAKIAVVIINENDPTDRIVGKTTGLTYNDQFEVLPVEEAGNDGVDEIVQGRNTTGCQVPGFFSPEINDKLPTRQNFLGRTWTILLRIAEPWPQAGQVLQAHTGCVLSDYSGQMGARGLMTTNLSFTNERRYNGQEWADKAGS